MKLFHLLNMMKPDSKQHFSVKNALFCLIFISL